jgi:2-dehydro-3-deoxyphosphooctonate aldolase (KDO 8-P synthase)
MLAEVKRLLHVPVLTDIHEASDAAEVAKVADILQIPAFLCRQTDLIIAAAKTGRIIHVKKGQFCSAVHMQQCVQKILSAGNNKIILCERGNSFGYSDLVVDTRNLHLLRGPNQLVTLDVTHCLQAPASRSFGTSICSGGNREFIPLMMKIAIVAGVHGIFLEVHEQPEDAKCDGPTQLPLHQLDALMKFCITLHNACALIEDPISK